MARSNNRAHAHRSPSDSGRWLNCPGSLNLTANLGERKSSVWSAEGTWAHQVREDCLDLGLDAEDFIGQQMFVDGYCFTWSEKDAKFIQPGIDRILQFEGQMVVEYKVDLNRWMPGDFGTLDCGIIGRDEIVINDLKYGQGERVDAYMNTQQMIYALGFWDNIARHESGAKKFRLMIDQPRAKSKSNQESKIEFEDLDAEEEDELQEPQAPGEFLISLKDLLAWGEDVLKPGVKATEDPDAPRIPGHKQCRWCAAAKIEGKCPEYEAWNFENLGVKMENLDEAAELGIALRLPAALTPERRTVLIQNWSEITRWYNRMHAHALADARV